MVIELDGEKIATMEDFHAALASVPGWYRYYGHNLDALWDVLARMMPRPLVLVWRNHQYSEQHLDGYEKTVDLLRRVEDWDATLGVEHPFRLRLE